MKKTFLISYDIRDEKRLKSIAKLMEQYAIRIELSVFILHSNKLYLKQLISRVKKIMTDDDDIRIYTLNPKEHFLFNFDLKFVL